MKLISRRISADLLCFVQRFSFICFILLCYSAFNFVLAYALFSITSPFLFFLILLRCSHLSRASQVSSVTPLTNAALLVHLKPKTRKETFMSNNKDILFKELSYHIIGAAFKVHTTLGCGFSESCYQTALALELQSLSIPFTQQERFEVYYNDNFCGFLYSLI
jgi:hypothetical protein